MPGKQPDRSRQASFGSAGSTRTERGAREGQRLFEIQGYWLKWEVGNENLLYCWYDERNRRTCRKTTGIADLEKAKVWLAKKVLAEPPDEPQHPDVVTVISVRRFYFEHHIDATVNGRDVVRDKTGPRRAFRLLAVYMWARLKEDGIEGAPRVGQFTLAWQHGFMRWCRDRHQLSSKSISTYLSYMKAGFNFSSKPHLITDAREREREVQVLSKAPHIVDSEAGVSKITGLVRSKPRDWIPSDAELAATLDELTSKNPDTAKKREPTFRYVIMALNTMARPEAITELAIKAQVRFDTGIVDMNPPGRLQNKKVRPIIRLTDNLSGWLLHWNLDHPLVYQGKRVKEINNRTLQSAARRAGVAEWKRFTRYTLRHYMATRVRRVPGVKVGREERATWMGHTDPDFRTTEEFYESMDADYLENARQAIDAIMLHLDTLTKRSLSAPGVVPGTRLTVIENRPASDDSSSSEQSA